jgi:hypothetical protein
MEKVSEKIKFKLFFSLISNMIKEFFFCFYILVNFHFTLFFASLEHIKRITDLTGERKIHIEIEWI